MRDYSKVSGRFWIGSTGKALRQQGPEAQVVALYLLTAPSSNMLGLYYLPLVVLAHETGLGFEGASKGLRRAIEARFCAYDEATEVVWVHEMARHQIGDSIQAGDKRAKGVQNEYDNLPSNPYLAPFFDRYATAFCMTRRRPESPENGSPFEAPSKPLRSQEQEQEQEQEQDEEDLGAGAQIGNVVSLFGLGEQEGHQGAVVVDATAPTATDATPSPGPAPDGPRKAPKPKPPPRDQARMPCADSRNPAERVLAFLNERAGRRFPAADVNLDLVRHRLAEGYSEAQLRQVVAKKLRDWRQDPKMAAYVRPATLFRRTNLAQYVGELGVTHAAD